MLLFVVMLPSRLFLLDDARCHSLCVAESSCVRIIVNKPVTRSATTSLYLFIFFQSKEKHVDNDVHFDA